jgi:Na+/H+ antiporter NhaD/arsenite permease-like protein
MFMFLSNPLLAQIESPNPSPWMILPFGLLLLCIALAPFVHKHFWEHHFHHVSMGLGAVALVYYVFFLHAPERMLHTAIDYLGFMSLVGSLFVIAGGIHITVKGEATPEVNCLYLLIGAILANIIGTTGASMLLIRPWIRMNKYRITKYHITFFIFIVSNVGGCLTPVGDPPLFLGYLKHVPFFWTMEKLWLPWIIAVGALIGLFYLLDKGNFMRAPKRVRELETAHETWRFDGLMNLGFLAVVLGAVFLPEFWREATMIAAAAASYYLTPKPVHESNDFSFGPIREVGWLFLGIFATMVPALDYLEHNAAALGVNTDLSFYLCSGSLSAFLDNAPTYLTFLSAAFGLNQLNVDNPSHVAQFLVSNATTVMAISLGSVFFGAMSYIGNGPNLMVKSIADQAKVHTPSFFGYIFKHSIPFLLPVLVTIGFLFFHKA